jgi:hypothetical protein
MLAEIEETKLKIVSLTAEHEKQISLLQVQVQQAKQEQEKASRELAVAKMALAQLK